MVGNIAKTDNEEKYYEIIPQEKSLTVELTEAAQTCFTDSQLDAFFR